MSSSINNNHTSSNVYQGLINQGSTCYLNSLIQTLFMTPQFRKNVYSYVHNSKKLQLKDSIPYQLQKLFVQLQTFKSKLVNTKGLLRSFQWTEADAFEQHDVQQFCRKLFEALQLANKKSCWINQLFEGSTMSFVNCGKHISQKQQTFMDLSLPIHNPYTKKMFQSLQQCLRQYLRPEKLQDKFQCDECNEQVQVQKGLRLNTLPPLLTIQLNRFQLNYETWQREKLNTFMYFPELLYMGKFLKKFDQIVISQLPPDLKAKVKIFQKQKSSRTTDHFANTNNSNTNVPKIKPKRKASDDFQNQKEKVFFYDESNKRQKQEKALTLEQQKAKNRQILADLKSQKESIDQKMKSVNKKQEKKQTINLDDDMLFGSGMGFLGSAEPMQWTAGSIQKDSDVKKPNFSRIQTQFEHDEQIFDPSKQYPENTYMLYAVLVHSGGAYGGHYYAYISNGRDWFRFDDSTVRKASRFQMRKYGNFDKSSHGSNAYLLFYRDVTTFKQSNPEQIQIPQQLLQKVKVDVQTNKQQQSKVQKRIHQIVQGVMIKLSYFALDNVTTKNNEQSSDPISIMIQNRHQQTIKSLKMRVASVYPELQTLGQQNWRLRRYNRAEDTLYEVYDQQYDEVTLENLGFRQAFHVAIETKSKNQEFQQYDPKKIAVKINVWRPDITLVTEKYLKPAKILISDQDSFSSLVQKIKKKTGIQKPVIIKRNFSQTNPLQVFSLNQSKKLIELRFFNGINLYIEQPFVVANRSRWAEQFQSQKYRCLIKYNNPEVSDNRDQEVYFDTRKTLKQFKQHLSNLINVPVGQFRVKKTKQAVSQLTAYGKKLYDLKFIANEFIYLEKGKSSCGAVILKQGVTQIIDGRIQFGIHQETIIQLEQNMTTVGDILNKLSEKVSIPVNLLRIRQYKAYQFGEIFRALQNVQRIKDKSLIWQRIKDQQTAQMKGLQLYVRVWDVMQMQLGQLRQIYVDSGATYQQFTYVLEQELGIKSNKILAWKALSNYIQKQILLDCAWIQICYIRRQIKEQPLYIMNDGQIYIIKQSEKQYHARVNYVTVGSGTGTRDKGKQAQLKITVMAENSDQQEEMIKQALNMSVEGGIENNVNNSQQNNKSIVKEQEK